MIRSMTGYGKAEAVIDGRPCTVEARCVNGRYLEPTIRLPKAWADKEHGIRETIREHVSRGTLSMFIRVEDAAEESSFRINHEAAATITAALRELHANLRLDGAVTLDHVLRFNEVFGGAAEEVERPDVWPHLKACVTAALEAMNAMRLLEGTELTKDFEARLSGIEEGLKIVEARSAERLPQERDRLRERVRQLIDTEDIDEQRLHLEIVLLSDKLDVAEECVRLRSHLKFFAEYIHGEQGAGRKLNFLLQEMNREVNTIGSKSNDAEIARIVVGMKEELERMREQIQNVE